MDAAVIGCCTVYFQLCLSSQSAFGTNAAIVKIMGFRLLFKTAGGTGAFMLILIELGVAHYRMPADLYCIGAAR